MLCSRHIQTRLLDTNREVLATKGCPQSGVLSPLLWKILENVLLAMLNWRPYNAQSYVDDIFLLVKRQISRDTHRDQELEAMATHELVQKAEP